MSAAEEPARAFAIDARAAVRPHLGGVERVARELVRRLPVLRPGAYRVLAPPPALAGPAGQLWEQALLPLRARGAAALLCPANLGPLRGPPQVLIVHDLAPLRHPEWFGHAYAALHRRLVPALVARAAQLVTPSRFTGSELADLMGVDPDRVTVAPNGVDPERFHPGARDPAAERRLGLDRPYVLTVGTESVRKNTAVLAAAARRLDELGAGLVLAGGRRGYLPAGGDGDAAVRRLGYVAEGDLPALYAGARALALPSLYEGFGLVALEAMASGVPVVAADRGALPETCGSAALLVDPTDGAAYAEALAGVLADEALGARLAAAGRERALGFGWDATAAAVDAACRRAAR